LILFNLQTTRNFHVYTPSYHGNNIIANNNNWSDEHNIFILFPRYCLVSSITHSKGAFKSLNRTSFKLMRVINVKSHILSFIQALIFKQLKFPGQFISLDVLIKSFLWSLYIYGNLSKYFNICCKGTGLCIIISKGEDQNGPTINTPIYHSINFELFVSVVSIKPLDFWLYQFISHTIFFSKWHIIIT